MSCRAHLANRPRWPLLLKWCQCLGHYPFASRVYQCMRELVPIGMSKSIVLPLAVLFGAASALLAQESFESLLVKLADDHYEVRAQAKKELMIMCREKPELTDRLALIIFDEEEEVERVHSAWEVVAEVIFVERGAIGITLNQDLIVERTVRGGPAMTSGIQAGFVSCPLPASRSRARHRMRCMLICTPPDPVKKSS